MVLPVVARELSVQARRRSTYWTRGLAAAVTALVMIWLLVMAEASIVPFANQGSMLFSTLSIVAFAYCLTIGAFVTSDAISSEKREGTIGLLFLTSLKGYDVVLGKLVSSSIHAVYGLLTVVPVLSLALLFGGVSAAKVGRTVLVLGNTMFFSLAAGIFVSTISRNERKSCFAALFVVLAVTAAPYQIALYFLLTAGGGTQLDQRFLSPSPAFAFDISQQSGVGPLSMAALYRSTAQLNCFSWFLLFVSCLLVPRLCKDRPRSRRSERVNERLKQWTGGAVARARFRTKLLERNPFCWLSTRYWFKAFSVWFLILPLGSIGLWIYLRYNLAFFETAIALWVVVFVLLKIWFAAEVCNRWIEDRRSGALELLLCVPRQTRELIHGQSLALWRQFGWPVAAAVGLVLLAWFGTAKLPGAGTISQLSRAWMLASAPVLIADLITLRWVGMWVSLQARGLNRALVETIWYVLGLRTVAFVFLGGVSFVWSWIGIGQVPYLSGPGLWAVLAILLDLVFCLSARKKFLTRFRSVASGASGYSSRSESVTDTRAEPVEVLEKCRRARLHSWWAKRWVRRTAFSALVAAVLIGAPFARQFWFKRKVEKHLAATANRFPASVAQLESRRPEVPDGENAAEVLAKVYPMLVNPQLFPMNVKSLLPSFPGSVIGQRESFHLSDPMKAAVESVLSSNKAALTIIRESPLNKGRYVLDFRSGGSRAAQEYHSFWMVSQLLEYEVILEASRGDRESAFKRLNQLIDLGRSLEHESSPGLMQLWVTANTRAIWAMRWLISKRNLLESDLIQLGAVLDAMDVRQVWKNTLEGQRTFSLVWYRANPVPQRAVGAGLTIPLTELLRAQLAYRLLSWTGAHHRSFLELLQAIDELAGMDGAPWHARVRCAEQWAGDRTMPLQMYSQMSGKMLYHFGVKPMAELEARRLAALTSLAIERFRIAHKGEIPENLDELIPAFIAPMPRDPFSGEALRYRALTSGYIVYSIGPDHQDNGGIVGADVGFAFQRDESAP